MKDLEKEKRRAAKLERKLERKKRLRQAMLTGKRQQQPMQRRKRTTKLRSGPPRASGLMRGRASTRASEGWTLREQSSWRKTSMRLMMTPAMRWTSRKRRMKKREKKERRTKEWETPRRKRKVSMKKRKRAAPMGKRSLRQQRLWSR